MNKTKLNYWIDVVIGIAFVLSAVSGIVFLFPITGTTAAGVTYQAWNQIHTWGSLLMVAGVLAHFVLHWKWLVHMTRKTFSVQPQRKTAVSMPTTYTQPVNRREFLRLAGVGALAAGAAVVGYKTLWADEDVAMNTGAVDTTIDTAVIEQSESIPLTVLPSTSSTTTVQTVSCPKGLTYDPYPGRCHHYRDSNGDGYCDYSIPA
ncbi:MAG: DUF4405 domain-containing protein [Ardenticatenaceae bacterium]|nr:DUF4405 domain-containing protein [Ardenticatenaceae bacterium]MCB9445985.1 DUF4405 domain-containing protein [Ardenticatenaceae bacterium]